MKCKTPNCKRKATAIINQKDLCQFCFYEKKQGKRPMPNKFWKELLYKQKLRNNLESENQLNKIRVKK